MTITRSGKAVNKSNSKNNPKRANESIGSPRKRKRGIETSSQELSIESVQETGCEPGSIEDENLDDLGQLRFSGCRTTNPLILHEIRINVARFLSRSDIRNCLLVCEAWWESFAPFLWMNLRPVYRNVLGGTNDYPPHKQMRKYGHLIRSFEYNGHGSVLLSMIRYEPRFHSLCPYLEDTQTWVKSPEEEAEEKDWLYVDEDIETDEQIDENESLSDFEKRIEDKRMERQIDLIRLKDVRAANKRQNEVSRFLNDNTDYRGRSCDQIETLIFTDTRVGKEKGCHYRVWIRLIQLNKAHLRNVEFTFGIKNIDAYREVFKQITLLERLEELTLVDIDIDRAKVNPFLLTICPRLSKLVLRTVRIEHGPLPGQTTPSNDCQIPLMPKMKSLTLNKVTARNNPFSLLFLNQCPNLVELTFRPQWGISLPEFTLVLSGKLTKITHLSFHTQHMSDGDTSAIIKALNEAQQLDLSSCAFGLLSNNILSFKHMLTISQLDLRQCQHLTGSMIQRILGECRYLRVFQADTIQSKDIINNSAYQNWACIGLRELTIDFRGDPKDDNTNIIIYEQLAQLTCLEVLDISRPTTVNAGQDRGPSCLTLSLKSGLGLLRNLVYLNKLVYRGIKTADVGVVELMWMAKAWPQLSLIGGKLKPRKSSQYNPNVHPKEEEPILEDSDSSSLNNNLASMPSNASGPNYNISSSNIPYNNSTNGSSSTSQYIPSLSGINRQIIPSDQPTFPPPHRTPPQVQNIPKPQRISQIPQNLMAIELRRLNLHKRIKVIPHHEDKVPKELRKINRYQLQGESSDEEQDRRTQPDPRYRPDLNNWMTII